MSEYPHVRGDLPSAGSWGLRIMHPGCLCPDLLRLGYIGPADTMRGRVVRAFFWVMKAWGV